MSETGEDEKPKVNTKTVKRVNAAINLITAGVLAGCSTVDMITGSQKDTSTNSPTPSTQVYEHSGMSATEKAESEKAWQDKYNLQNTAQAKKTEIARESTINAIITAMPTSMMETLKAPKKYKESIINIPKNIVDASYSLTLVPKEGGVQYDGSTVHISTRSLENGRTVAIFYTARHGFISDKNVDYNIGFYNLSQPQNANFQEIFSSKLGVALSDTHDFAVMVIDITGEKLQSAGIGEENVRMGFIPSPGQKTIGLGFVDVPGSISAERIAIADEKVVGNVDELVPQFYGENYIYMGMSGSGVFVAQGEKSVSPENTILIGLTKGGYFDENNEPHYIRTMIPTDVSKLTEDAIRNLFNE